MRVTKEQQSSQNAARLIDTEIRAYDGPPAVQQKRLQFAYRIDTSVVNPLTKTDKLLYLINDCRPAALIAESAVTPASPPSVVRGALLIGVPFGIATSGRHPDIDLSLGVLSLPADVVVVSRADVIRAKPEPDLFLACQERMGVRREDVYVVGDAVWDLLAARRAGMLSVGLLSGGYAPEELLQAGAFRVYRDPRELLDSLDELGIPGGDPR